MSEEQVTLAISVGGSLLGVVIGFFLNLWNSNRIEKRQENKNSLREHFDDFQEDVLKPISETIAGIGILDGSIITSSPNSLTYLDTEKFECFQAHYPVLAHKWQELAGEWVKHQGLANGRWPEQNGKAKAFKSKVEKLINERLTEARISLPIRPYQVRQEVINDDTPRRLIETFYKQIQGEPITYDFTKSVIKEDRGFYILEGFAGKWVSSQDKDIVKRCKSIFIDIQNSSDFKKEASSIIGDAKQIVDEFEGLRSNLDKIQSRGLISKVSKYEFKPVKRCPICKELHL